jgi:hypothetical protein
MFLVYRVIYKPIGWVRIMCCQSPGWKRCRKGQELWFRGEMEL